MTEQPGPAWEPPGWSVTGDSPAPPAAPSPPPGWSAPPGWGAPAPQQGWGGPPTGWGGPPPAPRPGVVPLRPLGLGEILDGAVSVVRRYWRPALGLAGLVALLATVINVLLAVFVDNGSTSARPGEEVTTSDVSASIIGTLLQVGVTMLAGILLTGIMTALVGRAVLGREIGMAEAWAEARPYIWRLLGLTLLTPLIVGVCVAVPVLLGVVAFAVGGTPGLIVAVPVWIAAVPLAVFLYVRLALAAPALILEKTGVRSSLRRSSLLVKGAFWRTFGILILANIIASTVSGILQTPFLVLGGLGSEELSTTARVVSQVGTGIALLLTQPFSSGVTALLYIDRRMRAEGLDVTLASAAARAA